MPASEIMRRFYAGTLKSSNGAKVTELAQAKAIAASYGGEKESKVAKSGYQNAEKAIGTSPADGHGKPGKLKTHEIHIKRGHKGGYIARHHLEDQDGHAHDKVHEYPLASMAALKKHLEEHLPEQGGAAEAAEADKGEGGNMAQENTEL